MSDQREERDQLIADLRKALARNQLVIYFQPKVSCTTGEITAFEALLRWNHPEHGIFSPGEFVPLLEEAGLMIEVGEWSIAAACAQVRAWQRLELGKFGVCVNLNARQLRHHELVAAVERALSQSGLEASQLELEVTEAGLMENADKAIAFLSAIRRNGSRVSVDDFGTGYSSLTVLKRFPLDVLKVDRSIVQDIVTDPGAVAVARAVIAMAHSLKLRAVAEGVETKEQLAVLIANDCDDAQGFFFSRPLPAEQIERLLRQGWRLPADLLKSGRPPRTLLFVGQDSGAAVQLSRILELDGYQIITAGSGTEAQHLLVENGVGVIVAEQNMPDMPGSDFLRAARNSNPDAIRILICEAGELQSVCHAVNEGVIDKLLTKPLNDEHLRAHIAKAFDYKELAEENPRLKRAASVV